MELLPENVMIVAVSDDDFDKNRAHMERFGLIIHFEPLKQQDYLNIVTELAKRENLPISSDFLHKQALVWLEDNRSVSGRTARQFIRSVMWELENN